MAAGLQLRGADLPPPVVEAADRLQDGTSYSWSTKTELIGAPVDSTTVYGKSGTNGFALLEIRREKVSYLVFKLGNQGMVKTASGWKAEAELAGLSGTALNTALILLKSESPTEEFSHLLKEVSGLKSEPDGSYSGQLPVGTVLRLFNSVPPPAGGSAKMPEVRNPNGTLRIWLQNGFLHKYVLELNGNISLSFFSHEVQRVSTVEIKDVGTTQFEIPSEAKAKLSNER